MRRATVHWGAVLLLIVAASGRRDLATAAPAVRVQLDGQHIQRLVLMDENGRKRQWVRPGPTLMLPEGQYRVHEVHLQGGFVAGTWKAGHAAKTPWFTVDRDQPARVVVGAPLTPTVTVQRRGMTLHMDYQLLDAAGLNYSFPDEKNPPDVTISRGERMLYSGTFKYG